MNGFLELRELNENYEQCKAYTRHHAASFYFSSHVLLPEKRKAAYAVYAVCRFADELADNAAALNDPAQAWRRLADLRNQIHYAYMNSPLMSPKLLAFRDTVFRYGIPRDYFLDLLRGVAMDLEKRRYETFAELKEYCYCVASVVGLMMAKVLGVTDEAALDHAKDLGMAMQLTNIVRDIGEDYSRGRVYIPREELKRFNYSEGELAQGLVNEQFVDLMKFQIERARAYYRSGELGIEQLPNDGSRFCVRLMSGTYSRILDAIERNRYNVFSTRVYVPALTKTRIALKALLRRADAPRRQPKQPLAHARVLTMPLKQHERL